MNPTVRHVILACAGLVTFYFCVFMWRVQHMSDVAPVYHAKALNPHLKASKPNENIKVNTTIRVGFVCVGTTTKTLPRMMKTLLYHTTAPVTFYLIGKAIYK